MIELIGLGAVAIMALNKKENPKSKDPFFEWDALIKKYSDQFKVPFIISIIVTIAVTVALCILS